VFTRKKRNILYDNDQEIRVERELFTLRLYDPSDFAMYLKEVGFKSIRQVKAFEYNKAPDPLDGVIVFECIK
jgi:hypothetical protein